MLHRSSTAHDRSVPPPLRPHCRQWRLDFAVSTLRQRERMRGIPTFKCEPRLKEMRSASVAGNSTDAGRSVTSKVTAILMVFADDGVHTLTEIAASAHLPTSTAHRLASELVAWRLLERTEERHYRIGLPLRMIASEYSESEVCSTTPDRDAGPAGARRSVKGHPQRGAAGHTARLRCPDVAAAIPTVLRTHAR